MSHQTDHIGEIGEQGGALALVGAGAGPRRALAGRRAWLMRRCAGAWEGQALVEYALLLAFIGLLLIGAFQFLQPAISNTLDNIANSLRIGG